MKSKLLFVLAVLLFLGGLCLIGYPAVKTAAFRQAEKRTIRQFEHYRAEAAAAEPKNVTECGTSTESPAEQPEAPARPFRALWDACEAYNQALAENGQIGFSEQSMAEPGIDPAAYGWEEDVFACLYIPSADIEVPVYLGASSNNLNRGAAVLGQTSLPIGGESSNCVICGHRTWNAIQHTFIGLENVQIGDELSLTNPWETLSYRVVSIETIYPDNLDLVRIQPGRDLLTVFTCTRPNNHRIVVSCERTITEEEEEKKRNPLLLPWVSEAIVSTRRWYKGRAFCP